MACYTREMRLILSQIQKDLNRLKAWIGRLLMAIWTLSEEILALDLYFSKGRKIASKNSKEVERLSALTGKSKNSMVLKTANFRSLDPSGASKGMSNVSELDKQVWQTYFNNLNELSNSASEIYSDTSVINYERSLGRVERPINYFLPDSPKETKCRVGQERVRSMALINYNSRCCICGMDYTPLLRASHIVPWRTRADIRADPANVLCLCSLHDSIFDAGLISLDSSGRLVICSLKKKYTILTSILVELEARKISGPVNVWATPKEEYLKFHRENIFLGETGK